MSFDFNPISSNFSNVQASAKSCPGGGGNTGYFQRNGEKDDNILEFSKDYPDDSFEHVELGDIEEKDAGFLEIVKKFLVKLIAKIRHRFRKKK